MLDKTELTIKRYYWPVAHALLQRCNPGKYEPAAHGAIMTLRNLRPELIAMLKEALPAGAVVEVKQEDRHAPRLHNLFSR